MRSWQVRVATLLVWAMGLPAAGCLYLAFLAFTTTDDLLMFVLPIVGCALLGAGLYLGGAAVHLALRLQRAHPAARLHTALLGGALVGTGLLALPVMWRPGLLLLLYGGSLLLLMLTPAAAADLGPWRRSLQQPAPWGSTPGTGLWAPAQRAPGLHPSVEPGPVQGPWAPDPRTLPWFSWKSFSGPRAPWWQTWQAGLARGIPLWELALLCLALLAFGTGLVAILLSLGGSAQLGTLHLRGGTSSWLLLLLPASWLVVAWLEHRMRARLATGRPGG
jgi:hypothetical protein